MSSALDVLKELVAKAGEGSLESGATEGAFAFDALVKLHWTHFEALVEALESINRIERLCDDSGELYGETIEATRLCAEVLTALKRDAMAALEKQ